MRSKELVSSSRVLGRSTMGCVALAALFAAGCHAQPSARFPTVDSAIARLRTQAHCSRAVQGEASLSFVGDGRRLNGRVLFLAAAPDRLRLDVYSPFGVTLSTLTTDGKRFGLYNLEEKSFLMGPPTTCNVERFTQVPAPPSALVELFRGQPPVLKHDAAQTEIRYSQPLFGRGYYQLEVRSNADSTQLLRIGVHPDDFDLPLEKQRLRLLRVEVTQGSESLYQVDLSGHATVHSAVIEQSAEEKALGLPPPVPSGPNCDAELPRNMRFFVPTSGHELSFKTEEVWHNPVLGSAVFEQEVPAGVTASESVCR